MTDQPITFVPKPMLEAEKVRGDVKNMLDYVQARDCVAMACVIVHADGTTAVQIRGTGYRTILLGAVTDLQFSIASDGDR